MDVKKILSLAIFFTCLVLCRIEPAFTQNVATNRNDLYQQGIDLFDKGLYADADAVLFRAAKETDCHNRLILSDIMVRRAVCAVELHLPNAEQIVEKLLETYPENRQCNDVSFSLANYFFLQKNYKKALIWFLRVNSHVLRYSQHLECEFKKGYCYFELNDIKEASDCFVEVKDAPNSSYSIPAMYYFGHTEYQKGNYVSALAAFENVLPDDRFIAQTPLYLVHIYYAQHDYDKVIFTGIKSLPAMSPPQDKEMARIIAEAYFNQKKYAEAREYFQRYAKDISKLLRSDEYFIGLIDYHSQHYDDAAAHFENVCNVATDSLAQNALYHLGAIYIQSDKLKAQNVFAMASKQNYSAAITQDAWLQYAKLSLELQNDGVPLQKYLAKYPTEAYKPELKNYSAMLHIIKHEYVKALNDLKAIPQPTDKQQADMQRLNFIIGKKLYDLQDARHYAEAINYFEMAQQTANYDAVINALAKYYQADIYFLRKEYKEAQTRFEKFFKSRGAFRVGDEHIVAQYNIGYCAFKQRNYESAISWFRDFISMSGIVAKVQVADAYNRIGDCFYVKKQYWLAAENYNKVIEMNINGADYALYRKSLTYGLLGRYEQKTKSLAELSIKFPKSVYTQAGLLELGRTQLQHNQYDEAEQTLRKLLTDYPKSLYKVQTLIELGLLCANVNRTEESINYYTQALNEIDPRSVDAKSALEGLKNTYANTNQLELYYNYLQSIDSLNINQAEKEEALFLAAEKLVNSSNCEQATSSLNKFIAEFPQSSYIIQAYFYLGNCYFQRGNNREATEAYSRVIEDPSPNIYKEHALANSGLVYVDMEEYEESIEALKMLTQITTNQETLATTFVDMAKINYHQLNNYREAADNAQSALATNRLPQMQIREILLIKANAWKQLGQEISAYSIYWEIVDEHVNDKENAEAMFNIIEIVFDKYSFEEGEQMVFDFAISGAKIYPYWIARSYIELAKRYALHGNITQAKATYNSIINNYKNTTDDILNMAKEGIKKL